MSAAAAASRPEVLALSGELTIYQAGALKHALLARLDGTDWLALDLSAVCEIDTSFVQLLFLLQRTAVAGHKRLSLRACSAAVSATLALLGLTSAFDNAAPDPHAVSAADAPDLS